jgi:hypothetical protein
VIAGSGSQAANDDIQTFRQTGGRLDTDYTPGAQRTPPFHLAIFQRIQTVTNFSTCISGATFDTFFLDLQHLLGYRSRSIKSSVFGPFGHFIGLEKGWAFAFFIIDDVIEEAELYLI